MLARIARQWKRILAAIVCFEIFFSVAGCANTFLLHPTVDKRDGKGAVAHQIDLNGKAIDIWSMKSPACHDGPPQAYLLEFCGNGTRAEDITAWIATQRWQQWPVEVWVMNYPGYGGSTGPAKMASIPPMALATYDSLRTVANGKPIFIEANSLGTSTAIYVASQRPTPAMVLTDPPPLKALIMQRYGWWNLWLGAIPVALQIPDDMNATETAPKVTAPACFMSADEDAVIPTRYHNMVIDAYGGPKKVIHIPHANHNAPLTAESEAELHAWIDQQWTHTFPPTADVR